MKVAALFAGCGGDSFGFSKEEFFELDEAEAALVHKAPEVKF